MKDYRHLNAIPEDYLKCMKGTVSSKDAILFHENGFIGFIRENNKIELLTVASPVKTIVVMPCPEFNSI